MKMLKKLLVIVAVIIMLSAMGCMTDSEFYYRREYRDEYQNRYDTFRYDNVVPLFGFYGQADDTASMRLREITNKKSSSLSSYWVEIVSIGERTPKELLEYWEDNPSDFSKMAGEDINMTGFAANEYCAVQVFHY